MLLIFVHGWSVTTTESYGELPEALAQEAKAAGLDLDVQHIHLGRYVSFHDEVRMDDLARAFDWAIREQIQDNQEGKVRFSCVTHSTGAPLVRTWIENYYGAAGLAELPLDHLVMLAPANHGSALANLGKEALGRLAIFLDQGTEPGEGVLDWLALGSQEQIELNLAHLHYEGVGDGFYPFVITGQTIDPSFYDHLNSYTDEPGSDGTVRVAAANLNHRYMKLEQGDTPIETEPPTNELSVVEGPVASPPSAFCVIRDTCHVGQKKGIMRSVTTKNAKKKAVVDLIIKCLQVASKSQYDALRSAMEGITSNTQETESPPARHSMICWRVTDDTGRAVTDYDLLMLGRNYDPDKLPSGFFEDRQKNNSPGNTLTYYVNYDKMAKAKSGKIGFRVVARPSEGFAFYRAAEFRSENIPWADLLRPNETLIVDIVLKRRVDSEAFRLEPGDKPKDSFKDKEPSGKETPHPPA